MGKYSGVFIYVSPALLLVTDDYTLTLTNNKDDVVMHLNGIKDMLAKYTPSFPSAHVFSDNVATYAYIDFGCAAVYYQYAEYTVFLPVDEVFLLSLDNILHHLE